MLSGTTLGFICVGALLLAAILLAVLDKKEKGKGNVERSRFLARMALGLFLAAFLGGVAVTLVGGVRPRDEQQPMAARSMRGIGGRAGSPPDSSEGAGFAGPERMMGGPGPMMGGAPMPGGGAIGKIDEAEFQKLMDKVNSDPKDVSSRERLGHLYLQQQDFENVFRMAHEALQVNPKSVESRVHMAMVLFSMGDLDQALAQFDQALQIEPKNLEALLFKGIVQFQGKDDLKGAKETWDRFMKIAKPSDNGYDRVQMFLKTINEQLRASP